MSTSSITPVATRGRTRTTGRPDRRGIALALVLGAQLMIILDMTVVNIALPSIARGLNFSEPDRAPMHALNEILWKSVKGEDSVMPAPVHRFRPLVDADQSDARDEDR